MHRRVAISLLVALTLLGLTPHFNFADEPSAVSIEFFEKNVRPLLSEHCQRCHGAKKQEAGLRLDSAAVHTGSDSGPVLVPGSPKESKLIEVVRYAGDIQMPPDGKLSDEQIRILEQWIEIGAPWPESTITAKPDIHQQSANHWAFQPVKRPEMPATQNKAWPQNPIDTLVLARLEAAQLTPSPPADRRTLIRRATFDLHGLPPSPDEVAAFENDDSPTAFATVIDRLLSSPRYGERWGRYWLDVARYADTKGYVRLAENPKYGCSWTYRDYVIRALNEDLPYDQFIIHQIAADKLDFRGDPRPLAAMGFLTLGQRFINSQPDIIDDRIDVVMRGLLGLTVSCARCHDHKFDPIPTSDYYGLYGVFASSVEPRVPPLVLPPAQEAQYAGYLNELQVRTARFEEFLKAQQQKLAASFRARAGEYLLVAQHEEVQANFLAVMFLVDSTKDLNPVVIQRWARLLSESRKTHHAVLAPWNALASLPEADFAERSQQLLAECRAGTDPSRPINKIIVTALIDAGPKSLTEVAQCYSNLFHEADALWQKELERNPQVDRLTDPDWEEIRQLLYGSQSPHAVSLDEVQEFLFVDTTTQNQYHEHQRTIEDWVASAGAAPHAMVLLDAPTPVTPRIFVRGNPSNPGAEVPRQFLGVLSPDGPRLFDEGSGRLELAKAIADKNNPLTARVLVNRIWMQHFGRPLVPTPSDFGLRSELPTHPELLDYLAWRFMADGWSIKKLHRLMLLSATYQQQSLGHPQGQQVDPENVLLWRMNRRRLDWESLRDALIIVTGEADLTMGGPGVDVVMEPFSKRRSVYAFIDRQNLPSLLRTFDLPSPDATSPQRHVTTVPQQALFLMNSPFMKQQTRYLAARRDLASSDTIEHRVERIHQLLFARGAREEEIELAKNYLAAVEQVENGSSDGDMFSRWEEYVQALLLSNEFTFID